MSGLGAKGVPACWSLLSSDEFRPGLSESSGRSDVIPNLLVQRSCYHSVAQSTMPSGSFHHPLGIPNGKLRQFGVSSNVRLINVGGKLAFLALPPLTSKHCTLLASLQLREAQNFYSSVHRIPDSEVPHLQSCTFKDCNT